MIEVLKQALEALETTWYHVGTFAPTDDAIKLYDQARTSLRQAIAELESQKPIAYINVEKRTLEFAQPIKWYTPTVVNLDRIPLFTKEALEQDQNIWSDDGSVKIIYEE